MCIKLYSEHVKSQMTCPLNVSTDRMVIPNATLPATFSSLISQATCMLYIVTTEEIKYSKLNIIPVQWSLYTQK